MQYRISEVKRLGLVIYVGTLYAADGAKVLSVDAWSLPGALTALRRAAFKLAQDNKAS
jgi:hypothetical protein